MDSLAIFAGLSPADQAALLARHFGAKARQLRREAAAPAPPALRQDVEEAPEEEIFVPEEVPAVEEAAIPAVPAEEPNPLLVALGLIPAAAAPPLAAAAAEDEADDVEMGAGGAAAPWVQRIIKPDTVLSVVENAQELVEYVRNGEIIEPLWGTARYVKDWRAGKRGDPALALPTAIRQCIRRGVNTKRAIQEDLGVPLKDVDASVREMSKMGIILT
jgi:hypothetical protein